MNKFSYRGWRLYNLLRLAIQPHAFFNQLYGLNWYQAMLRDWYTWLQPAADTRILEVGCSSGGFSAAIARYGHRVTGLDRSTRAIRYARRHHVSDHLQFVIGDALHLPWSSQQFNLTLAASLLNVVDSSQTLLREMRRVTTANGSVSCLFPTPEMHRVTVNEFIQTRGLLGFSASTLLLWADAARKLRTEEVTQLFISAGFINIHTCTLLQGMVAGVRGTVTP